MGQIVSSEVLGADPKKLRSINEMPPPTNKQGVQRILGLVNYVRTFTPNGAGFVKPLRDLVKKQNEFAWDYVVHGN